MNTLDSSTSYTNLTNPYVLQWLFSKPSLRQPALSLLNSLIGPDEENPFTDILELWSRHHYYFLVQGAFTECQVLLASDRQGNTHYIEWHLLRLHPGIEFTRMTFNHDFTSFFLSQRKTNKEIWPVHVVMLTTFGLKAWAHCLTQITYPLPDYPEAMHLTVLDLHAFAKEPGQINTAAERWMWLFRHGLQEAGLQGAGNVWRQWLSPLFRENLSAEQEKVYNRHQQDKQRAREIILEHYRENKTPLNEACIEQPAEKAEINLIPMEQMLQVYPPRAVRVQDVDLGNRDVSPLAFGLFRQWLAKAQEKFPQKDLSIKDENALVQQTRQALQETLIAFYQSDKYIKNHSHPHNWCREFRISFEVRISRLWYYEFIYKTGNLFKIYTALQALLAYLNEEETRTIMVTDLYKRLMEEAVNLSQPDWAIDISPGKEQKYRQEPNAADKQQSPVMRALVKLYLDYEALAAQYKTDFFVTAAEALDDETISTFLERNRNLFRSYSELYARYPLGQK